MSTLRALANSLGLSITTVSRALDGYGDVSAKTRMRVELAAAELGYRPNAAARRLRKGTSDTVAFVMPTGPGHFFEPAFAQLLAEIGNLLAAQRLDLTLMAARPGPEELAVYRRIVEDKRADACILVRARIQDERVAYLANKGFPFVLNGQTETPVEYASVDGAGDTGFATLARRLAGLGRRRIAHIAAPQSYTFGRLRLAGWRQALEESGLAYQRWIAAEANEEGGLDAARALLAEPEPPDAIVAATDRMAIGALRALADRGIGVGEAIALAGHDNISQAAYTAPPLTSMELPHRQMAESIVAKLIALIGGARPGDLREIFEPEQIKRRSTGEA